MKMQKVSFGDLNIVLKPNSQDEKTAYNNFINKMDLNKVADETDILKDKDYHEDHNILGNGFNFKSDETTEGNVYDFLKSQGIKVKVVKNNEEAKIQENIDSEDFIKMLQNEEAFTFLEELEDMDIV